MFGTHLEQLFNCFVFFEFSDFKTKKIKMPEVWEGKKYENYESLNFDEYMQELGKKMWNDFVLNDLVF